MPMQDKVIFNFTVEHVSYSSGAGFSVGSMTSDLLPVLPRRQRQVLEAVHTDSLGFFSEAGKKRFFLNGSNIAPIVFTRLHQAKCIIFDEFQNPVITATGLKVLGE
jgi:hypothetical protein